MNSPTLPGHPHFAYRGNALFAEDVRISELARTYHAHHFNCQICIAAGRGSRFGLRCGVGAALWYAYNQ